MKKHSGVYATKDRITVMSHKRKAYKKSRYKKAMDRKLKKWTTNGVME